MSHLDRLKRQEPWSLLGPGVALLPVLGVVLAVSFALCALLAPPAQAVCVPFPCDGCWVVSSGQLNLVVLDRQEGIVRLVPNIRFEGESPEIALVVPTPAVPTLHEAPARIWTDATALTAPASGPSGLDGFGCSTQDVIAEAPGALDGEGVVVLSEQTVGGFEATIIRSDDPQALVRWLRAEGFPVEPADAARLAPLVADGWVFTAMKSDSTLIMPTGGWNANVAPVEFRWSGDRFEVPLGLLETNRADFLPLTFFVVDDHRTQLVDFAASYGNRISGSERAAIGRLYPGLAGFVREGEFLTRLDRTFSPGTPMEGRVTIERAPSDEEFRRGWRQIWAGSGWLALVAGLSGLLALERTLRAARTRQRSPGR